MKPLSQTPLTELCTLAFMRAQNHNDPELAYLLGAIRGVSEQLLAAAQVQHGAIDGLMAECISKRHEFKPTQHPAWPAVVQGNNAIKRAKGEA